MVADAGAFSGFAPQAPPAVGPPADLGAPPPGFGEAPAQASFGATAQSAPNAPAMSTSPMQQVDEPLEPIPGIVGGPNPIVTVLLIIVTCGIYGIYLLVKGKKQAP